MPAEEGDYPTGEEEAKKKKKEKEKKKNFSYYSLPSFSPLHSAQPSTIIRRQSGILLKVCRFLVGGFRCLELAYQLLEPVLRYRVDRSGL